MSDDPNVNFSTNPRTPEQAPRPPYTLVLAADFQPGQPWPAATQVDKDNFAQVLANARPALPLAIKPPIGTGGDWEMKLTFDSLRAFEPAGLLAQLPQGRARLNVWEQLRKRRRGQGTAEEMTTAIRAAVQQDPTLAWLEEKGTGSAGGSGGPGAGAAAPQAPAGGGSILDLVDEPDAQRRIGADVERLAAETEQPSAQLAAAEAQQIDAQLRRLTLEMQTIVNTLLREPAVRALEETWRGAKFLVDRLDFRTPVRLMLVHAKREALPARLNEAVIEPAFDGEGPTPGMLLLDYAFEKNPADTQLLTDLAGVVAGFPVLAAFPVAPAFFGVKSASLLKNLPNLANLLDGWEFAKWRSLRDQPESRWLVPVFGRFLLRGPYEPAKSAQEFTCAEEVTAISQLRWGGGHLAMGLCAARSYARHGWPTRMFGAEAGKIEDLPVAANPNDASRPWGPGDLTLPDRRLDELPATGMNLLQSMPGKDYCMLLGGVTASRPIATAEIGQQQAVLEVSLPYQQFSSLASAWLCEQPASLHGLPEEEIQRRLLFGLRDFLGLTEEDAKDSLVVGVGDLPEDAGRRLVHVQITPPARIAPGGLHVGFDFTVRR